MPLECGRKLERPERRHKRPEDGCEPRSFVLCSPLHHSACRGTIMLTSTCNTNQRVTAKRALFFRVYRSHNIPLWEREFKEASERKMTMKYRDRVQQHRERSLTFLLWKLGVELSSSQLGEVIRPSCCC